MPERRLLIDIGNSRLKWIWTLGPELDAATAGEGGARDLERALGGVDPQHRPAAILLSSVAGSGRTAEVAGVCRRLLGREPTRLVSQKEQCGVRNGYRDPARLGVDRWLALLGAVHHHGKPVVVWDLGTATTLDAVDGAGLHMGGWILPGPTTMLASLGDHTRLSVPPELGESREVSPAASTADAIVGGVKAAQLGALERFVEIVRREAGSRPKIVATGGVAAALSAHRDDVLLDRWIVFRGMQLAAD